MLNCSPARTEVNFKELYAKHVQAVYRNLNVYVKLHHSAIAVLVSLADTLLCEHNILVQLTRPENNQTSSYSLAESSKSMLKQFQLVQDAIRGTAEQGLHITSDVEKLQALDEMFAKRKSHGALLPDELRCLLSTVSDGIGSDVRLKQRCLSELVLLMHFGDSQKGINMERQLKECVSLWKVASFDTKPLLEVLQRNMHMQ